MTKEKGNGLGMATGYVFYNKKAGQAQDKTDEERIKEYLKGELKFIDTATPGSYREIVEQLRPDDYIVLCGGDGTINCFVNQTEGMEIPNEILYYPNGTGNDFAHDLGYEKQCEPFSIKEYIKDLPVIIVNDKKSRFLNGIGYGIDGYCCEVGDELKKIPGKKVNYTAIAIKGLLFHYKTTNATVTVDGVTHTFKGVWLAPTMNGRFYGGGMMPTPAQQRIGGDGTLSTMVMHGAGKLKTLMVFPSIFKGEHIKHEEMVKILTGRKITVEFDRPTALQIDGETVLGVTSYTAIAGADVLQM